METLSCIFVQVIINGEAEQVADGVSVAALVRHLKLNERRLAIEVNREIVPPERYPAHRLREGDQIEIVHFVGGG